VGVEGHVLAFEPHPDSRALLLRAVAANGLQARVTVSAAALGVSGAGGALRSPRAAGGFALARLDAGAGPLRRTERRIPVEVRHLDDLDVDRPVSLVKLDIEGSEALALRGAARLLRRHRPAILCELDEILLRRVSDATPEGLMAWMEHAGYDAFAIAPDGAAGARLTTPPTARTSTVLFLPA
jgi:FkbM family methyltransferase